MLTAWPELVCPRCRGALRTVAADLECAACAAHYPVVLGVPDLRVDPDPWIGLEEDRDKARRVAAASEGTDFAASVATYWAMTPATPPALARRFTAYVVDGERRAAEWLDVVAADERPAPAGPWLDIGCATGDLLAEGARRGVPMVGVDVALRWLVLARRRRGLQDGSQRLVCCNGEHLPFRDGTFARVVSVGTLEHCADGGAVMRESARVLAPGGVARLRTVNRFTLLPEPHVGVWGVGFVPRRWADRYVRWRSGQRYQHHRPLSPRELVHAMRRAGLGAVRVTPAALLPSDIDRLPTAARRIVPLYRWVRRTPLLAGAVAWTAPVLDARGAAPHPLSP